MALTREEKKRGTSAQIRNAAVKLFESRGYTETTAEDIVAEANVSRRTFFRYFPCKESLLFSTLPHDVLYASLRERLDAGVPVMDAIIGGVEASISAANSSDEATERRRRLRHSLLDHPSIAAYYQTFLSEAEEQVRAIVREYLPPEQEMTAYVAGAVWHAMAAYHVATGETHHFAPDSDRWREAVAGVLATFPQPSAERVTAR